MSRALLDLLFYPPRTGLRLPGEPFLLWWIHGDYERYAWIMCQLFMYFVLLIVGLVLTVIALAARSGLRRLDQVHRLVGATGDILVPYG